MYEKLIEALRAEAGRWEAGMTPAYTGDLQDILNRVADRLEGEESPFDLSTVTLHPASERITNPTEPPSIPSLSQDDRLDIRCRASHTTPAPPNDDDEPLTAEWLESAQPEGVLQHGVYWSVVPSSEPGYTLAIQCRASADWASAWQLNVTTRGDYRALRRMLGVPMEDA